VVDDMVLGIEERATELGFMVMLSFSRDDSMREWAAAQAYRDRRVEGLLLMPVSDSRFASAEQFAEFDIPLVILDRPSNLPVDQIYVANKEPMRDLTRHLITLGHTRLAFVSLGSNAVTLTQRREGFQAAVESASVPLDSTVIVTDSAEELRRLVTDTMSSSPAPTGFVTASQTTTGHLLEATAAMGLRVPEDIALVCFDDFPFANILSPRLTSAVQPAYTLGREAMSLLHTRMQDGDAEPRSLVLTPEIRHRDSCGCGEADVPI
jgi:LacI family transcriptional regulator